MEHTEHIRISLNKIRSQFQFEIDYLKEYIEFNEKTLKKEVAT